MGIFGGYLAGARAAREDKLRERQQDEAERRARADEALRQSEAERAQANADRQFEQSVAQADRDYALRSRAAEQDAALKAQDMGLRQALGELEYAMKGDEMQGRREDRALTREIKQQEAQLARERMTHEKAKMENDREMQKEQLAGAREDRTLRGELGRANIEGAKEDRKIRREESQARRAGEAEDRAFRREEAARSQRNIEADRTARLTEAATDRAFRKSEAEADRAARASESAADRTFRKGEAETDRAFRKEESAADRDLRQQAIDQGTYQFERTQANADARLGLELDKGRVETQVLGVQLDAAKQRWADEQKERDLRLKNDEIGTGLMMSMAMIKPGYHLDANDIADITKQYPQFAKLGLRDFMIKYNPETGNMDGLMIVGDGKDKNSVKVFDQAQMANALRAAGYTDESVKRTFEYMRPDIGITKLKTAMAQKEAEQAAIESRQLKVQGLIGDRQMMREEFKAKAEQAKAEVKVIDERIAVLKQNLQLRSKTDEQKAEMQREIDELEQKKSDVQRSVTAQVGATATGDAVADPLATKYGKYLKK